jgi:hypothetical protein
LIGENKYQHSEHIFLLGLENEDIAYFALQQEETNSSGVE